MYIHKLEMHKAAPKPRKPILAKEKPMTKILGIFNGHPRQNWLFGISLESYHVQLSYNINFNVN